MYTRSWYKMSHRINVNNSQPCSFFWLNSILVNIVFFMYYFSIILSSLIHSVIHCLIHNSVVVKAGCVATRIKFKCESDKQWRKYQKGNFIAEFDFNLSIIYFVEVQGLRLFWFKILLEPHKRRIPSNLQTPQSVSERAARLHNNQSHN